MMNIRITVPTGGLKSDKPDPYSLHTTLDPCQAHLIDESAISKVAKRTSTY